jgi:hypothetical protein
MIFTLFFYVIPFTFPSWILPKQLENMIFTTVDPKELWPISSWLTTNIEYAGIMHTFLGFRFCYMLCLFVSTIFITTAIEVFKKK